MEHLWAPWRMQFIDELRGRKDGCVFCELASPGDDRERLVLFRGEGAYVLMNRFPYNSGHLMIIPYKHTGKMTGLGGDDYAEMMKLAAASADILSSAIDAEGFNCGFNIGKLAGAGITDHIHLHMVPRWAGDSNFLPIIGNTRSMPEYLANTYDRLVPGFKKLT